MRQLRLLRHFPLSFSKISCDQIDQIDANLVKMVNLVRSFLQIKMQKFACQFRQYCQFLFSEPWSIQLLLIVNPLSHMVVNCR